MKKVICLMLLVLTVIFIKPVIAWQEEPWVTVENSYNKDSHMRQVQLTHDNELKMTGLYRNKGDYLLECRIQGFNFSIIYNTTNMTIWGMIFPGAIQDKIGIGDKTHSLTIERKGVTKTCFGTKCWGIDRIRILHAEDDEFGWCPSQIDFIPVSAILDGGKKGKDRPLFQKVYSGIVNFRGQPEFFGPKVTDIYIRRFMPERRTTWSEQKRVSLEYLDPKFLETDGLLLRNGTPVDYMEVGTMVLIYDKQDIALFMYQD